MRFVVITTNMMTAAESHSERRESFASAKAAAESTAADLLRRGIAPEDFSVLVVDTRTFRVVYECK